MYTLSAMTFNAAHDAISTGSLYLDLALGTGGIPRGQISELRGPESAGKTTLCQHVIAEAQKCGGLCAFIDADHALDPAYARRCGVDLKRLYLCEPEHSEQAFEVAEILARSAEIAVVVVDSITALSTQDELQAELGRSFTKAQTQLVSQTLRRLAAICNATRTALLLTSQACQEPSMVYHPGDTCTARMAIQLHSALRLDLEPGPPIQKKGEILGNRVRIRVRRNKFAPSFHTSELVIMYNEGIAKTGEILDLGTELSIISRQGSVFSYGGLSLGKGREEAISLLRQKPRLREEIENLVRQRLISPARLPVEL